jgi:integrase/recombinase XerD
VSALLQRPHTLPELAARLVASPRAVAAALGLPVIAPLVERRGAELHAAPGAGRQRLALAVARSKARKARTKREAPPKPGPRRHAPGELAAVQRATERLWRRAHLTYDDTRQVAKGARRRLELSPPAVRKGARPRLTSEQIGRFLAAAYRAARGRGGGDGMRARGLLVKTLLLSGARVAEFVRFRVEDLDVEGCELLIRDGKGGKARRVPILPELAHELRTHIGRRRAGWLFETVTATGYSVRRVQYIVKEIAEAAGVDSEQRVYPHLLRHTIAQHLLDRGMPVDQVRQFLGHADIRTTQIYAEASPAAVAVGYRRALGGGALSESWARSAHPEDVAALRSLGLVVRPAPRGAGGAAREPRDRRARPRGKEARPGSRRRGGPGRARAGRAARGRSS